MIVEPHLHQLRSTPQRFDRGSIGVCAKFSVRSEDNSTATNQVFEGVTTPEGHGGMTAHVESAHSQQRRGGNLASSRNNCRWDDPGDVTDQTRSKRLKVDGAICYPTAEPLSGDSDLTTAENNMGTQGSSRTSSLENGCTLVSLHAAGTLTYQNDLERCKGYGTQSESSLTLRGVAKLAVTRRNDEDDWLELRLGLGKPSIVKAQQSTDHSDGTSSTSSQRRANSGMATLELLPTKPDCTSLKQRETAALQMRSPSALTIPIAWNGAQQRGGRKLFPFVAETCNRADDTGDFTSHEHGDYNRQLSYTSLVASYSQYGVEDKRNIGTAVGFPQHFQGSLGAVPQEEAMDRSNFNHGGTAAAMTACEPVDRRFSNVKELEWQHLMTSPWPSTLMHDPFTSTSEGQQTKQQLQCPQSVMAAAIRPDNAASFFSYSGRAFPFLSSSACPRPVMQQHLDFASMLARYGSIGDMMSDHMSKSEMQKTWPGPATSWLLSQTNVRGAGHEAAYNNSMAEARSSARKSLRPQSRDLRHSGDDTPAIDDDALSVAQPGIISSQGQILNTRLITKPQHRALPGFWFTLQAAEITDTVFDRLQLPHIPKPYIRIKDGDLPVSAVKKYLVTKLGLSNESEVEIRCRGKVVLEEHASLKDVRDKCWMAVGAAYKEPTRFRSTRSSTQPPKDHVMVLTYRSLVVPPPHHSSRSH